MTKSASHHVPGTGDLERLYWELAQRGAPSVGRKAAWKCRARDAEELLVLAADMMRYDPRLLSILLQWVVQRWRDFNPRRLRDCMQSMRWPQALLVVLEFALLAQSDPEFEYFASYVSAGWQRIDPPERLFLDLGRPGSRIMKRKLARNLRPYARWGFIATERPTSHAFTHRVLGSYDVHTRKQMRDDLLRDGGGFTLADYLNALDHCISRQQAYHDLKQDQQLRLAGKGRGARWVMKRSEKSLKAAVRKT